jgi:hypothetical protein
MKSTTQPKSSDPEPVAPSRWHRWLLAATIAMEAVWILLLVAMTQAE